MKKIHQISIRNFNSSNYHALDQISNYNDFTENDVEKLIEENPYLIGDILIIGNQVEFKEINDKIDLLALDKKGNLVIIDTKADLIPTYSDFQLIKYASYLQHWTEVEIKNQINTYYSRKNINKTPDEILDNFYDDYQNKKLNEERTLILIGKKDNKKVNNAIDYLKQYGIDIKLFKIKLKKLKNKILIDVKKAMISQDNLYSPTPQLLNYDKNYHLKSCTKGNKILINSFLNLMKELFEIEVDWSNKSYITARKNKQKFMQCFINDDSLRVKINYYFRDEVRKNYIFSELKSSLKDKELLNKLKFLN